MAIAKKIKYRFENGALVVGTIEQIESAAKGMGFKIDYSRIGSQPGYYPSSTKGLVKISSMNEMHIRRALIKRSQTYLDSVFAAKDSNRIFSKKFVNLAEDPIVKDLFIELQNRA